MFRTRLAMPASSETLPGRAVRPFEVPATHAVLGTPLEGPVPEGLEIAVFGMGCFWGAEEIYWREPGVWSTAVGYAGGTTPNPTYEETCSGMTGHAEVVRVVYDPTVTTYEALLKVFWERHDPTQGYQQGNDIGTQYRSTIYYTSDAQREIAEKTREVYAAELGRKGYDPITTEIAPLGDFYYAEDYHQQYLYKVPNGYRCHATTGVRYPASG